MLCLDRKPYKCGNRLVDRTLQFRNCRTERWVVILSAIGTHRVSAHAQVRGVLIRTAMQGTHDRYFVHDLRESGHMFADLYPGNVRRNRLEGPPNFQRSIDLQVKHVLMRRASRKIDHDHRLVPQRSLGVQRGRILGMKDFGKRQPTESEPSDF